MKKLLSFILAAVVLTASFTAAQSVNDITVRLDGVKIEFDVQPQIINDRTMVPMRAIFEALGTEVMWDETTRTVTSEKDDTVIIMAIGEEIMFVNYAPVTLDAPPQIIGDRTLVPVRAIAESFDCKVDWNDVSRTVTITTDSTQAEATPSPDGAAASDGTAASKETASPKNTTEPKATATPKATSPAASADPEETAVPEETAAPEETADPEETVSSAKEQNLSGESGDTGDENISADEGGDEDEEDVQSEDIFIRYESGYELSSHTAGGFRLTSIRTTADGNYEIEYYVQTFQDESGRQMVIFDCLDENDKVIDSFGGYFYNDAYSWSDQTGTAVISGKTAKIRLSEENQK